MKRFSPSRFVLVLLYTLILSVIRMPTTKSYSEATVDQREATFLGMWLTYEGLDNSSNDKKEIFKEIKTMMEHSMHIDSSIDIIVNLIFGYTKAPSMLGDIGQTLVGDWGCEKSMTRIFESHCGSLADYQTKHVLAFENMCNSGISMEAIEDACISTCEGYYSEIWDPLIIGYSV